MKSFIFHEICDVCPIIFLAGCQMNSLIDKAVANPLKVRSKYYHSLRHEGFTICEAFFCFVSFPVYILFSHPYKKLTPMFQELLSNFV